MATTIDLNLEKGVKAALAYLKFHPDADALDAAYAALVNQRVEKGVIGAPLDELGRGDRWIEFLAAVREAVGEL